MSKCSSSRAPRPFPPGVHTWLVWLKATRAIGRVNAGMLKDSGLGESEFRVLEVLLHKGALPVNTIGPKVDLVPGSISVAVDRLYGRGLVTRTEDPGDRRVRLIDLTSAGRRVIATVFRRHALNLEAVMQVLPPEERLMLENLMKKVGRNAEKLACLSQDRLRRRTAPDPASRPDPAQDRSGSPAIGGREADEDLTV